MDEVDIEQEAGFLLPLARPAGEHHDELIDEEVLGEEMALPMRPGGPSLPTGPAAGVADAPALPSRPGGAPALPVRPPMSQPEPIADYELPDLPPAPPQPMAIPLATRADDHAAAPIAAVSTAVDFAPEVPDLISDEGIVAVDRPTGGTSGPEVNIDEILVYLLGKGGSDLHLTLNSPPMIRVHGDVEPVPRYEPLTMTQLREALYAILTERQKQRFEETHELDFAYALPGAARFRVNLFMQQGSIGAVMRAIPWEILALEALHMPDILGDFANLPRGLVLVTGPTGSGKSTTLAAIIDKANRTRAAHIMTIEDPVEFVHQHRRSIVNQREVGPDTDSFNNALVHALRQDPDIILVGEMRDLETISIALTAAETGHLVFGTLHTSSAPTTIDRIIDVFPTGQQSQIRTQLANSVQAIVCQTLCRTADGKGRIAATEVMIATPAVRNLIREGKLQSIPSSLQTGAQYGMHTLNQDLARLVEEDKITYAVAREKASDIAELNQLLGRAPDATN